MNYVNALKCCKAFIAAKYLIGAEVSSLDDCFINGACYVITSHAVLDAEVEKYALMDRRM